MMLRPGDPLWQKLRAAANAPRAQLPYGVRFSCTDAGRAALAETDSETPPSSDAHATIRPTEDDSC